MNSEQRTVNRVSVSASRRDIKKLMTNQSPQISLSDEFPSEGR
ncbi:MAG: hypothetical protein SWZ49_09900 [Cyanobacteriota bacterium]|nr:hypothetical protein [Cyanobacteriota bacterium]